MIERLEVRRLLAGVSYDEAAAVVKIHGTAGDDVITIVRRDERLIVTMNGVKRTFDRRLVARVEAFPGAGNDVVDAQHTAIPLHAFAGGGNDTIVGGWGNDFLWGQDQSDRLIGMAGDDLIEGGGGRDVVFGGDGADTLVGGTNLDRIFGNAGDDEIADYQGHDSVDGGAGGDWLKRWDLDNDADLAYASVEGQTLLHVGNHSDPVVRLQSVRRRDGQFAVVVTATHSASGYDRIFGGMTRNKRTFHAYVTAIDLAPNPDSGRLAVIETESHTYILGRLADGTYTFNAGNPQRLLASMTIQIDGGRLVDTPATPVPPSPSVVPL